MQKFMKTVNIRAIMNIIHLKRLFNEKLRIFFQKSVDNSE